MTQAWAFSAHENPGPGTGPGLAERLLIVLVLASPHSLFAGAMLPRVDQGSVFPGEAATWNGS